MRKVLGVIILLLAIAVGVYVNYFRSPIYSETKLSDSYDFIIGMLEILNQLQQSIYRHADEF